MNVAPIRSPLPGEHLAATSPTMRPETAVDWRQRLNFWAGRSLTAEALELEQEHRAARLARQGRIPTAGIVRGLDVALERPEGEPGEIALAGHFLHVLAGSGFTVSGEDVTIPRSLRISLDQVPISYVRYRLSDDEVSEPAHGDAAGTTPLEFGGVRLEVDGFAAGYVPWAAVLIARPAELGLFGNVDPTDPCELDPSRDAFADERRLDASVLRLIQLPVAWESHALLADRDDPRWRNRLAHVVFEAVMAGAARQYVRFLESRPVGDRWDTVLEESAISPWDLFGVPLAVLSSELVPGGGRQLFLDRASVTRPGGRTPSRSRVSVRLATEESDETLRPVGVGTPALWRGRVDQFSEHLRSLSRLVPAQQASRFQFLPPAGLLAKGALDFLTTAEALLLPSTTPGQPPDRAALSRFFPAAFAVEAVPVPIEDLDAALASSAPLAPFDLTSDVEAVRIMIPLPQKDFDPALLVVELEDPFFAFEVARLVAVRQERRQRRDLQRNWGAGLQQFLSGPKPLQPAVALEPGQFEPEPVESVGVAGAAAYLSPNDTPGPWEISANFGDEESDLAATPLSPSTVLFVRLRLDFDRPPSAVEVRWRRGDEEFVYSWATPSEPYTEHFGPDGTPERTPLARLYTVTAADLGVTSGTLTGFTLRLIDGRVGLIDAGQVRPVSGQGVDRIQWWNAQDSPQVSFRGGGWLRVTGSRMTAPLEELVQPDFGTDAADDLGARVTEVESALNPDPAVVTPRAKSISVAADGLEKALSELEAEANEADDFVDANFLRAQTNLYRLRKLILGESAAQKLLVNPAISIIAEQETASASAEKLNSYLTAAKKRAVTSAEVNQALRPTVVGLVANVRAFGAAEVNKGLNPLLFSSGVTFGGNAAAKVRIPESEISFDKGQRSEGLNASQLKDIFVQLPESGPILPPRGLSIGERFKEPPATNNLAFARSALVALVGRLTQLRLPLVGETVRSLKGQDVSLLDLQGRSAPAATAQERRTGAINALLDVTNLDKDTDEAEVTLAALDFIEVKSAILRTIERVVQQRRSTIKRGQETLNAVRQAAFETDSRVAGLEATLAEARHDVGVGRALRQEEQERVAQVNERRDLVLRDQVKFLAYVRPRSIDPVRRNAPGWKLGSSESLAPVPACLRQHDQPPDGLHAYVQLFRHAPARWFTDVGPRLRVLDTREKLVELLEATQRSALVFASERRVAFAQQVTHTATRNTLLSAFSIVETTRTRASALQLVRPATISWKDLRREAEDHSSLGDIIDGRHGNAALSRAGSDTLEKLESVATCLHAEFASVAPAIRLAWVERYSQFDRPSPLRDLTVLPQYGSLDRASRRRFQAFVDWLFQRVDAKVPEAFNLINDLVRICLLLASHAPVKKLIAGHLPRPVAVRPGVLIPIRPFDPKLVKVGMEVHVWRADQLLARARVEDLGDGDVTARIERLELNTTTLDQTMHVQFVGAALGLKANAFRR